MKTVKKIAKIFFALAMLAAVTAAFFGAPTKLACRVQPAPTIVFLIVLLLTPFVGRLFCECMCPLGILQSLANRLTHPRSAVRRVCTRLSETRAQLVVRWFIVLACATLLLTGFGALAWCITPYAIYGKALACFIPGLVLFASIIILAMFGKGRIWCNWICPIGTIFTLLAKKSVCEHKVAKSCANCRACFPKAPPSKDDAADARAGVTRRETLQGFALLAATEIVEKTTDGGCAPISLPGKPARPSSVLPPGAVNRELFNRLCVGCGLCVATCKGACLSQTTALTRFGQPEMDFRRGFCLIGCEQQCAKACPAGALRVIDMADRKDIHMGHAIWKKDLCVRTTNGDKCTACVRKCPVKAIHLVDGFPVIDKRACIGCGACEHVCPARPIPAIFVKGFNEQRVVMPMTERTLIDEMLSRVEKGASCVVAKDGVIIGAEEGAGLKPLMTVFNEKKLNGSILVDKVIGRAAAAVCIVGEVKRVHARIAGADAMALLRLYGIEATAEKVVPKILNKDLSEGCPLEQAVDSQTEPKKMLDILQRIVK